MIKYCLNCGSKLRIKRIKTNWYREDNGKPAYGTLLKCPNYSSWNIFKRDGYCTKKWFCDEERV